MEITPELVDRLVDRLLDQLGSVVPAELLLDHDLVDDFGLPGEGGRSAHEANHQRGQGHDDQGLAHCSTP